MLYTRYGIGPSVGWNFLTGFHFSLITLIGHNPQILITLCIEINNEHTALFD